MLSLTFAEADCTVDVYVFGDEADPGLCPTGDPDEGCHSKDYLHRMPNRP
ncbi:hypothetical protein ACPCSC_32480 [Streptomyces lavendulocolor]